MKKNKINELQQEKNELNAIINRGIHFEVDDVDVVEEKRWFLKRKKVVQIRREYIIKELTLSTLDRLSAEFIEFAISNEETDKDNAMSFAKDMARKHALRCARIIAIAVLNEKRLIPRLHGNVVVYEEDTKEIDRLTSIFANGIKPSELYQIYLLINTLSNLGDFMNSIRLMSEGRTTMPIRIEEE